MYRNVIGGMVLLVGLAACGGDQQAEVPAEDQSMAAEPAVEAPQAHATLTNDQGTDIGTATLTQQGDTVRIAVDLAFLQGGLHGFHIHSVGTCEAPDFETAGGHFNPTNAAHGFENPEGPHAGDLENLDVYPDDGTVETTVSTTLVTLLPGQPNSLLDADGSSLVVHAGPDDYTSQPSGDSGARIACGVIEQG